MKSRSTLLIAICAGCTLLAIPSAGFAQGALTSGTSDFAFNASAFDSSPSANFRVSIPTDHLFEQGWWYRVAGDALETAFPVPDSQTYVGNVATLDWVDVDLRGFAAHLVATIVEGTQTSARVQLEMTITNNTGADLNIDLFNMADFDLQPLSGDDSATLIAANETIGITTGGSANTAEYRGLGATAFLVRPFGATDIGAVLGNGTVDNFDNSGLPFGPGDFTAGFQWTSLIPVGASAAFNVILSVNEAAEPLVGSCCVPDAGCFENLIGSDCTVQGGAFNGLGSVCTPNPCPSACCLPDTTCQHLDQTTCEGLGGNYTANAQCIDTDSDTRADICENCPDDPNKFEPGVCGCGVADIDSDGDFTLDCNDGCPDDGAKTAPGDCGCGVADIDSDSDLIVDCNDGCPDDGAKTAPGDCGCGVADIDSDGDLTLDCNDGCPDDGAKTAPGDCGCGVADIDSDGDGIADCNDTGEPPAGQSAACGLCGDGMTMMMSMFIPLAFLGWRRSRRWTHRRDS